MQCTRLVGQGLGTNPVAGPSHDHQLEVDAPVVDGEGEPKGAFREHPRGPALAGALDRDHDGSVLDDLGGFLSKPDTRSGDGILRHTLGEQRGAVEQELGRRSGVDAGSIAKLLPILAPVVMGALGKAKRQDNLDTGGLVSMLSGEEQRAEKMSSGTSGMLSMLLDSDRDGSITDDVAKHGMGFLGKLLRRRR